MTTQHTPTRFHLPGQPEHAWPPLARLRRLLGILLILAGGAWLGLSLAGHPMSLPSLIGW